MKWAWLRCVSCVHEWGQPGSIQNNMRSQMLTPVIKIARGILYMYFPAVLADDN